MQSYYRGKGCCEQQASSSSALPEEQDLCREQQWEMVLGSAG